jgi:hypothetical protein
MSKTKYSVLIFPKAENDLIETKTYFEEILKTSPTPLFEKFLIQIDILEDNPFIFPLLKDPHDEFSTGKWRIYHWSRENLPLVNSPFTTGKFSFYHW